MKLKIFLTIVGMILLLSFIAFRSDDVVKEQLPTKSTVPQFQIEKETKKEFKEQEIFPEHSVSDFSDLELEAELKEREEFEADSEVVEAESYEETNRTQKANESIETMRDDLALLKALEKAAKKTPTPAPSAEPDDQSVIDLDDDNDNDINGGIRNATMGQLGSGILSRSSRGHESTTTTINKPTPTPTEEPTPEPRYTGQVRGYSMLYLMQPEARRTVEGELQTLIASRLEHVFLGALTDGTFSKDFNYLSSVIERIAEADMKLTLALYLTNGSSMRRYTDNTIKGGFNNVSPSEFRSLIQYDRGTREKYISMVREVLPIFQLNQSLNHANKNIAVVMLEDNLDAKSYKAMRELTESILGNLVSYVRNPCPGCYEGNDADSLGDGIELHGSLAIPTLGQGMGFSLDGEGFFFPWESGSGVSSDAVKFLQASTISKKLAYFGLWRAKRQGIYGDGYKAPALRLYEVPTEEQREVEIEILRDGLEEK